MAVTLGGSLGITYPDASTTAAGGITSRFSPYITDTANVMYLYGVKVDGSVGVYTPLQRATTSSVTANITLSANTANYVLNTAKVAGYVAGVTNVTLTINSGVIISSASTGTAAFIVDNSWAAGDTITVINNGTILGRGGNGGGGGAGSSAAGSGTSGGLGLLIQKATSINNGSGRIAGGGGGGGGGGGAVGYFSQIDSSAEVNGGSGGGGIGGSSPNGTLTAAGSGYGGSSYYDAYGGTGGSGGTYGSNGSGGGYGYPGAYPYGYGSPGGGGAAGAAVSGNSLITWISTGTRNGAIA